MSNTEEAIDFIANVSDGLGARFLGRSGSLDFYGGSGAFKFSIIPPSRNENGFISREGSVLIEAGWAIGKKPNGLPEYSWSKSKDDKINFALTITDITQMIDPDNEVVKLFHKDQNNLKNPSFDKMLILSPPSENFNKYSIELSDKIAGTKVRIPLTTGQVLAIQKSLLEVVPYLAGWPV